MTSRGNQAEEATGAPPSLVSAPQLAHSSPAESTAPARLASAPAAPTPAMRVGRGLLRLVVHAVNLASNVLGDDWASKRLRLVLLRAMGARFGARSYFHGGTYFSDPRHLKVGQRCFVNRNCFFDLEAVISIGDDVVIGHGTTVVTTHHRLGSARRRAGAPYGEPVTVEDGVWIGANALLMPGVTVGRGSVVGAGALVLHDVAPDTVVAGVPARRIRDLTADGD
jgi:maltose O-acetyltransferase